MPDESERQPQTVPTSLQRGQVDSTSASVQDITNIVLPSWRPDQTLEHNPDLSLKRARRQKVCAAECRKKVVKDEECAGQPFRGQMAPREDLYGFGQNARGPLS